MMEEEMLIEIDTRGKREVEIKVVTETERGTEIGIGIVKDAGVKVENATETGTEIGTDIVIMTDTEDVTETESEGTENAVGVEKKGGEVAVNPRKGKDHQNVKESLAVIAQVQ